MKYYLIDILPSDMLTPTKRGFSLSRSWYFCPGSPFPITAGATSY